MKKTLKVILVFFVAVNRSGHESYLNDYKNEWTETVRKFLDICK
jgi:hypothetical protein